MVASGVNVANPYADAHSTMENGIVKTTYASSNGQHHGIKARQGLQLLLARGIPAAKPVDSNPTEQLDALVRTWVPGTSLAHLRIGLEHLKAVENVYEEARQADILLGPANPQDFVYAGGRVHIINGLLASQRPESMRDTKFDRAFGAMVFDHGQWTVHRLLRQTSLPRQIYLQLIRARS